EIPGPTASRALAELAGDEDRAVALTAAYVLTLRRPPAAGPATEDGPGPGV
ncbi:MerR family transcriptional regulator, partial [Streptomyces sp. SR27]|nr:MerR family transcriptional regulator [Streptomyces sp. SR27]